MFTVLFEKLAFRIVLERLLEQLEFLEPNRLISLVVSMRSRCQAPISFLCMMYRCLKLQAEKQSHPLHLEKQ